MPSAHSHDTFFDEGVVKMTVKRRRRDGFDALPPDLHIPLPGKLRQRNMKKRQIKMNMRIPPMLRPQTLRRALKPRNLTRLNPIVPFKPLLVRAQAVRVEEVDGDGGVGGGGGREHFDVVVAHALHFFRAGVGEGVGEGLEEAHLLLAGEVEGAFVVVVAEDGCVGDFALDEGFEEFEEGRLRVGGAGAFDLVAGEDDEGGGFVVEDAFEEAEGAWVGFAVDAGLVVDADCVSASTDAGGEVGVGDLEDLEATVFAHARVDFFLRAGLGLAVSHRQSSILRTGVELDGRAGEFPAVAWIHRVRSEQHIHRRDRLLRIRIVPFVTPQHPNSPRPTLPLLALVPPLIARIRPPHLHAHDHLLLHAQLLLLPPLHMQPGAVQPAGVQVQVLLDARPLVRIPSAGGEGVGGAAEGQAEVGDDEAGVVGGEVRVQGVGQHFVARVGQEEEGEDEEDEGGDLAEGPGLIGCVSW